MTTTEVAALAEKPVGPMLRVDASCSGCAYERSVSYRVQGDSGHDIFCDHPVSAGKQVGDSRWTTPDWCPVGATMLRVRHLLASGDA